MSHPTVMPGLDEEEAAQRLRDYDILPTQQRVQIARLLLTRDQHLSADQVLELVNATGNRVSKATVYNTLGLFARQGILREVNVDPSRVFYDTNNSRHHHFYNIDTGELSDIDLSKIPVEQLPEAPEGSLIDGVEVIIRVRHKPD
ncbi:MAG: Fur family transcriptional regulator [Pseudomonadota bacterium]|nr:Fur family transcriptional regulator [Pseudomonadota bacterium]